MTREVITVDVDDPISRVADLCIVHRVRRVPVMQERPDGRRDCPPRRAAGAGRKPDGGLHGVAGAMQASSDQSSKHI